MDSPKTGGPRQHSKKQPLKSVEIVVNETPWKAENKAPACTGVHLAHLMWMSKKDTKWTPKWLLLESLGEAKPLKIYFFCEVGSRPFSPPILSGSWEGSAELWVGGWWVPPPVSWSRGVACFGTFSFLNQLKRGQKQPARQSPEAKTLCFHTLTPFGHISLLQ